MKDIIKEPDFRRELKSEPSAGYLFFGEEDYLKANAIRLARKALCGEDEGLAYFNDVRLGGADFTPDKLLDAMVTPPMGAERKVITVTGINFNAMRAGDLENLLEALSELENYPFWLALYRDRMTYPYKVEMWQYTDQGRVPGIEGPVDLNIYMPD